MSLFLTTLLFWTSLSSAGNAAPFDQKVIKFPDHASIRFSLRENSCEGKKIIEWKKTKIASTAASREKGLSHRKKPLDPTEAMLFVFNPPQTPSFWMKNTYIPLGLLFFRADGSVAGSYLLRPEADPMRPQMVYPATEPVSAAIEIPFDQVKKLEPQFSKLRGCVE